jgi:hypothetical protein
MSPKNTRLRPAEGILLLSALGLVLILYFASSRSNNTTSDSNSHGNDNANMALAPLPAVTNSTALPTSPLEFLGNRSRRGSAAQQAVPNSPIDIQNPAQAVKAPSEIATPGTPTQLDRSKPQSLDTGKGPPGIPVTNKMLNGSSEALRNESPAVSTSAP